MSHGSGVSGHGCSDHGHSHGIHTTHHPDQAPSWNMAMQSEAGSTPGIGSGDPSKIIFVALFLSCALLSLPYILDAVQDRMVAQKEGLQIETYPESSGPSPEAMKAAIGITMTAANSQIERQPSPSQNTQAPGTMPFFGQSASETAAPMAETAMDASRFGAPRGAGSYAPVAQSMQSPFPSNRTVSNQVRRMESAQQAPSGYSSGLGGYYQHHAGDPFAGPPFIGSASREERPGRFNPNTSAIVSPTGMRRSHESGNAYFLQENLSDGQAKRRMMVTR